MARYGEPGEFRGNYLLNQTMGVETHLINVHGNPWDDLDAGRRVTDTIEVRKSELEAQGHTLLVVGAGGAHPDGFVAHALTFREMLQQSSEAGVDLDFVHHTIGTGTALPGMLAAKISLGHPLRFRSVSIQTYDDGDQMNPDVIVERIKAVLESLGAATSSRSPRSRAPSADDPRRDSGSGTLPGEGAGRPTSRTRRTGRLPVVTSKQPFETVVEAHGATVLRVCRAVLGSVDADDAWSETFLASMRAYPDLPAAANVEAWLVTIAHRKAIDAARRRARRPTPMASPPDGGVDTDHARVDASLDAPTTGLVTALQRLPNKQRHAVVYHYLGGLPYDEVAAILGGTSAAARRAASDGVANLRRSLPHDPTQRSDP